MNIDVQLKKSDKKIILVKHIMILLKELNEIEDYKNPKNYTIKLSYQPVNGYIQFNIDILRNNKHFFNNLNFKLDSIDKGFKMFDEIQNYFINNFDISFSSISDNDHTVKSSYNIDLKRHIYTKEQRESSIKLNDKCWENIINSKSPKQKIFKGI
jgi:hypothetical protein